MIAAWHIGLNDPDALGYTITAGYLIGCFLSVLAARSVQRTVSQSPELFWFWIVLAISLLLLGVNKQLDLQDELREVGQRIAKSQGWYEERRRVQSFFVALIVATVLVTAIWLFTKGRSFLSYSPLACLGAALLISYAVIRACTFYHTSGWVRVISLGSWNCLFELAGILCLSIAAVRTLSASKTTGASARDKS